MNYIELKNCIVCGKERLVETLNLGDQPLINNLKNTTEEFENKYPLVLNTCQDCTHQQLSVAVDPEILFNNYFYQTGTSESHKKFFKVFVSMLRGKSVLDIGCNDGTLLKEFKQADWEVTGIDPAKNLTVEGIDIIKEFFPSEKLAGKKFDVITAFNVFAHNSAPWVFLEEMKALLNENGKIFILTTPATIGNIYHEHISYFNSCSIINLASSLDLEVVSLINSPMHGSSQLFELRKKKKMYVPEKNMSFKFDRPMVGYGASASGMTLLNYYNLKPEYVIDDNPLKQGKFVPGVNVPIYNISKLLIDQRSLCIIILAYNLSKDIISKVKHYRPFAKDIFINPLTGKEYE